MDKSMPAWNLRGMLATPTAAAAVDILPYRQPASLTPQCGRLRLKFRQPDKIYGVYGSLAVNLCANKPFLCQYAKQHKTARSISPPDDSATGHRHRLKANKNPAAQGCRV
jgi:hypothetical protein